MPRGLLMVSRRLRKDATRAEYILWGHLRDRRLSGAKFRRQAVIGRSVVDFACHEHHLIIELDGSIHDSPEVIAYDQERQALLEAQGYRVLRFHNEEIIEHLSAVLERISSYLQTPE